MREIMKTKCGLSALTEVKFTRKVYKLCGGEEERGKGGTETGQSRGEVGRNGVRQGHGQRHEQEQG